MFQYIFNTYIFNTFLCVETKKEKKSLTLSFS